MPHASPVAIAFLAIGGVIALVGAYLGYAGGKAALDNITIGELKKDFTFECKDFGLGGISTIELLYKADDGAGSPDFCKNIDVKITFTGENEVEEDVTCEDICGQLNSKNEINEVSYQSKGSVALKRKNGPPPKPDEQQTTECIPGTYHVTSNVPLVPFDIIGFLGKMLVGGAGAIAGAAVALCSGVCGGCIFCVGLIVFLVSKPPDARVVSGGLMAGQSQMQTFPGQPASA